MAFLIGSLLPFSRTLDASNKPLINAGYFIFPACLVSMCAYSMVPKHRHVCSCWSEGHSKSTFCQLRMKCTADLGSPRY